MSEEFQIGDLVQLENKGQNQGRLGFIIQTTPLYSNVIYLFDSDARGHDGRPDIDYCSRGVPKKFWFIGDANLKLIGRNGKLIPEPESEEVYVIGCSGQETGQEMRKYRVRREYLEEISDC